MKGKLVLTGLILLLLLIAGIIAAAVHFSHPQDEGSETMSNERIAARVVPEEEPEPQVIPSDDPEEETTEPENEEPEPEPETVNAEPEPEPVPTEFDRGSLQRISGIYLADNGCYYVDVDDVHLIIANKIYGLPEWYGGPDEEATAAMYRMFDGARAAGHNLQLVSGYRSYSTQAAIHARYTAEQGEEAADRISAEAGHSEHQTGLAFDILSDTYSRLNAGFDQTAACQWMMEHCWEYGFVLRYLADKTEQTGYSYEPWHYRYIGDVDLAREITESGLSLEEFLGLI